MSGLLHLARRFLGSLSPRPLDRADDAWVRDTLSDAERGLWDRMSLADRKHAAGVARDVDQRLDGADRPVLAAALLHDVGKVDARLGTIGRVVATVAGRSTSRERVAGWTHQGGFTGRVGRYLHHDAIGARLLEDAGSAPETVAWAREHHLAPERWSLPADVADALAAADDD